MSHDAAMTFLYERSHHGLDETRTRLVYFVTGKEVISTEASMMRLLYTAKGKTKKKPVTVVCSLRARRVIRSKTRDSKAQK